MPVKKNDAKLSADVAAKTSWTPSVKVKSQTVIPEGLQVQVHQRESLPDNYRICNGTSFETYRPKTWGR